MLSDVSYPSIADTSLSRDFVEFPAQIIEHYVLQPQILTQFAGELTHALRHDAIVNLDVAALEAQSPARIQLNTEIPMRHLSPHFAHNFSGGYSAGNLRPPMQVFVAFRDREPVVEPLLRNRGV